jgi:urease accessory protein UreF
MHHTRGAADAPTMTGMPGISAALLLIADSRLPAGGHAHSGGVEEAVHVGAIAGPEDLARFLRGRLATAGLVTAALSAAACHLAAHLTGTDGSSGSVTAIGGLTGSAGGDGTGGLTGSPGGDRVGLAAGGPLGSARGEHMGAGGLTSPTGSADHTGVDPLGSGEHMGADGLTSPTGSADRTGVGGDRTHTEAAVGPGLLDGADRPPASEDLWRALDAEADARTASPAMRVASRTQGRLLVRSARRIWPSPMLDGLARALPDGAHHAVALGAVAHAAGCPPREAALAAAYNTVTGPATAAVRLLGLDPVTVHRLLAVLAPELDGTASDAAAALDAVHSPGTGEPLVVPEDPHPREDVREDAPADPLHLPGRASRHRTTDHHWAALPSTGAPALDLLAEGHLRREVRLFVS